uniref:Uncharacterized protein n=1 Tax=Trichobilharzia regenti TaxID=157069 RepID=A0AA85IYB6_TRIRE|nr:unnamed protein product [Trichobilharzia regenti]
MLCFLVITFLSLIHSLEAGNAKGKSNTLPTIQLPYFHVPYPLNTWLESLMKLFNLGCVFGQIWDIGTGNFFSKN